MLLQWHKMKKEEQLYIFIFFKKGRKEQKLKGPRRTQSEQSSPVLKSSNLYLVS